MPSATRAADQFVQAIRPARSHLVHATFSVGVLAATSPSVIAPSVTAELGCRPHPYGSRNTVPDPGVIGPCAETESVSPFKAELALVALPTAAPKWWLIRVITSKK